MLEWRKHDVQATQLFQAHDAIAFLDARSRTDWLVVQFDGAWLILTPDECRTLLAGPPYDTFADARAAYELTWDRVFRARDRDTMLPMHEMDRGDDRVLVIDRHDRPIAIWARNDARNRLLPSPWHESPPFQVVLDDPGVSRSIPIRRKHVHVDEDSSDHFDGPLFDPSPSEHFGGGPTGGGADAPASTPEGGRVVFFPNSAPTKPHDDALDAEGLFERYRRERPHQFESYSTSVPAPDRVDSPPAPAPVDPFIHVELKTPPREGALLPRRAYKIAVDIRNSERGAPNAVPANVGRPAPGEELELIVEVTSNDFDIKPRTSKMRVLDTGLSAEPIVFTIRPRGERRFEHLFITFHRDGNLLQQLKVEFAVGEYESFSQDVKTVVARPLSAAGNLKRRSLGLTIERDGDVYSCTAWAGTSSETELRISREELIAVVGNARTALLDLVMQRTAGGARPFLESMSIPDAERDYALRRLATAGHELFTALFRPLGAGQQAEPLARWFLDKTQEPETTLKLQIHNKGAPIPWAMMYVSDEPPGQDVDWEKFLGMRHVIEQIPIGLLLKDVDKDIEATPPETLCVSLNVADIEDLVQRQKTWWERATNRFDGIDVRNRTKVSELLESLNDPTTPDHILYFYCHADIMPTNVNASSLVLDEMITLRDLRAKASPSACHLRGMPLVFLNACESAEMSPMFYSGFVPYFMDKGARGVIGTECKVPAVFAAEFAMALFDEMLMGESLGDAVLDLRRRFFLEHGNLLGLLYGVHCNTDLRLLVSEKAA